jgi:hypothetical protein
MMRRRVDFPAPLPPRTPIFAPGRHVKAADKPFADLLLAILQTLGVSQPSFGNSTGPLNLAA